MPPSQKLVKRVLAREGAEAIYQEDPILAHVRVHNIRTGHANPKQLGFDLTPSP